jgi:hypothetical protein
MRRLWCLGVLAFVPAVATAATLTCKEVQSRMYYDAAGKARLRATVVSDREIRGVHLQLLNPSRDDELGSLDARIKAAPRFRPRNPAYKGYNRFSLPGDAWCVYNLLLPGNVSTRRGRAEFPVYVQHLCEEGWYAVTKLPCKVR